MSPANNTPGGRITWVRLGDLDPAMQLEEHHFVALDERKETVGIVRLNEYGTEAGSWMWSMTRVHVGKPFMPRSGTEKTRREAALALVASWRAYLKWYGIGGV